MNNIQPQKKVERIKRVITLPVHYWNMIETRQDGILIKTYTDCLIDILDLTCRNNLLQKQPKKELEVANNFNIKDKLCNRCGHDIEVHVEGGCLAEGGLCECKRYEVKQPQGVTP
jgi:hypothetical protein